VLGFWINTISSALYAKIAMVVSNSQENPFKIKLSTLATSSACLLSRYQNWWRTQFCPLPTRLLCTQSNQSWRPSSKGHPGAPVPQPTHACTFMGASRILSVPQSQLLCHDQHWRHYRSWQIFIILGWAWGAVLLKGSTTQGNAFSPNLPGIENINSPMSRKQIWPSPVLSYTSRIASNLMFVLAASLVWCCLSHTVDMGLLSWRYGQSFIQASCLTAWISKIGRLKSPIYSCFRWDYVWGENGCILLQQYPLQPTKSWVGLFLVNILCKARYTMN